MRPWIKSFPPGRVRSGGRAGRRAAGLVLLGLALAACSYGPRKKDLLPDEGPTTREVYDRHMSGLIADPHAASSPTQTSSSPELF
jgi:hypothetical protein